MNNLNKRKTYRKAKKRVQKERGFYTHATVYIVMNIVILIFKIILGDYINNEEYNNYQFWNLISTPLFWGLGLLGHGIWTFREKNGLEKLLGKSIFSKKWEEQKINEFMNKNNDI
ncbi:2TM domain-containing protein [Aquimarina sp. RZ0]|uniref:2TM domain-containing protein n=1 Tax=Aquimarina sp. RZ0 TaxID=2607730 RepID=UPI0011F2D835|nr:2TM domain-containing protein [Aquimarina sp. RZ0]KAA1244286.1 2TM domain-containing protein [Aquimarina sp. RZ0]